MTERIRVSGFRRPRGTSLGRRRPGAVPLVRPLNLVWVVLLAGAGAVLAVMGSPHLLLAYTTSGSGAYTFYTDCAYAGLDGRMIHTSGASCPTLRFLKSNARS